MPRKPPRICGCGFPVAAGERCPCQQRRDRERKARFDKTRPSSSARGYTGRWDVARKLFLQRNPRCRMPSCSERATVVDHIQPHRGREDVFWDMSNWQPLCRHHHNSTKQRAERREQKEP